MKFGVVQFPGSNCDHDCYHVATLVSGVEAEIIWHDGKELPEAFKKHDENTCIILPGGFSYGDYLRCGAIARFSPIMEQVIEYGKAGGKIIGICNGFQVLVESGLLPGVLHRNKNLQFICKDIHLKVENKNTSFTSKVSKDVIRVPIAHGEGNYYCDDATLKQLEANDQILFRYCDESGDTSKTNNPNGSRHNIAGICNEGGNILGMMPHPERCSEEVLGNTDGRGIFESIVATMVRSNA